MSKSRATPAKKRASSTHEDFFGTPRTHHDDIVQNSRQTLKATSNFSPQVKQAANVVVNQVQQRQTWAQYAKDGTPAPGANIRRPAALSATPLPPGGMRTDSLAVEVSQVPGFTPSIPVQQQSEARPMDNSPEFMPPPAPPPTPGFAEGRPSRHSGFFSSLFSRGLSAPAPVAPSVQPAEADATPARAKVPGLSPLPTNPTPGSPEGRLSEGRPSGRQSEGRRSLLGAIFDTVTESVSRLSQQFMGGVDEVDDTDLPQEEDRVVPPQSHDEFFGSRNSTSLSPLSANKSVSFKSPIQDVTPYKTDEAPEMARGSSDAKSVLSDILSAGEATEESSFTVDVNTTASTAGRRSTSSSKGRRSKSTSKSPVRKSSRKEASPEAADSTPIAAGRGRSATPVPTPPAKTPNRGEDRSASPSRNVAVKTAAAATPASQKKRKISKAEEKVLSILYTSNAEKLLKVADLQAYLNAVGESFEKNAKKAQLMRLVRVHAGTPSSAAQKGASPKVIEAGSPKSKKRTSAERDNDDSEPTPDSSWTVARLRAYARVRGLDVGKATKVQILNKIKKLK